MPYPSPKLNGKPTAAALANGLATLGRYGDSYMVHASEGETIVPAEILDANPGLKDELLGQMRMMGIRDPNSYVVGNSLNSINPITGQPEFFFSSIFKAVKKVFKKVLPVVAPIVGNVLGGPLGGMVASGLVTKLQGGSWGDVLKNVGMSYGLGALTRGFTGAGDFFTNVQEGLMAPFGQVSDMFGGIGSLPAGRGAGIAGGWGGSSPSTLFTPPPAVSPFAGRNFGRVPAAGIPSLPSFAGRNFGGAPPAITTGALPAPTLPTYSSDSVASGSRGLGAPDSLFAQERAVRSGFDVGPQKMGSLGYSNQGIAGAALEDPYKLVLNRSNLGTDPEIGTDPEMGRKAYSPLRRAQYDRGALTGGVPITTAEGAVPGGGSKIVDLDDERLLYIDGEFVAHLGPAAEVKPEAFSEEWLLGKAGEYGIPIALAGLTYLLSDDQEELTPEQQRALTDPQRAAYDRFLELDPATRKNTPEGQQLMAQAGIVPSTDAATLAGITGTSLDEANKYLGSMYGQPIAGAAKGGIVTLHGGGEITGPGSGISDSIPARLSDGEFVMTADAVRGAGNGSRDMGAARMYDLMSRFERAA